MINIKRLLFLVGLIYILGIFLIGCDILNFDDNNQDEYKIRGCKSELPYYICTYIISNIGDPVTKYENPFIWYSDPVGKIVLAKHYILIITFEDALSILKNTYGEPNYSESGYLVSGLYYEDIVSNYSYTILEERAYEGGNIVLTLHRKVVGKENKMASWILEE